LRYINVLIIIIIIIIMDELCKKLDGLVERKINTPDAPVWKSLHFVRVFRTSAPHLFIIKIVHKVQVKRKQIQTQKRHRNTDTQKKIRNKSKRRHE